MARDHGRVLCKIWRDKDFRVLPRSAQALYMQLLSQPDVNNAGVLPLMVSKWAKGCEELTRDDMVRDIAVLVDAGFIVVDTETEEVLIRSFIRNDGGMKHRYIFKNALKMAEGVDSEKIRVVLAAELRRTRDAEAGRVAAILDPSGSDRKPFSKPSEPDPNADVNPSEWDSNPIENASESDPGNGMAFESDSDRYGEGEGEGVGETPVVGHLGGVARTPAREARTREAPASGEIPTTPYCARHPGGTPDDCRACGDARRHFEATAPQRAKADAAQRRADATAVSEAARANAAVRAHAIAGCGMCDADGRLPSGHVCGHDPSRTPKPGRGAAAVAIARCRRCDPAGRLDDGTDCDHSRPAEPGTTNPQENPAHA